MLVAGARGGERVVGPEQQDRARAREQAALVRRQREPRGLGQALVRLPDPAPEAEVPDGCPDHEEEDDQDDRDPDLAAPADLPRPARAGLRTGPAVPAPAVAVRPLARRRLLGPADSRHAAFGAPSA